MRVTLLYFIVYMMLISPPINAEEFEFKPLKFAPVTYEKMIEILPEYFPIQDELQRRANIIIAKHDINHDELDDYILQYQSKLTCGIRGCVSEVFISTNNGYIKLQNIPIVNQIYSSNVKNIMGFASDELCVWKITHLDYLTFQYCLEKTILPSTH